MKKLLSFCAVVLALALCVTACTPVVSDESSVSETTATTTTVTESAPSESTPSESAPTESLPTEGGETTLPTESTSGNTTQSTSTQNPHQQVTLGSTTAVTTNAGATVGKDKVVDMNGHIFYYGTAWQFQTTVEASDYSDFLWHEAMAEVMEDYNCKIIVKSLYASPDNMRAYIMADRCPADVVAMLNGSMFMPALGAGWLRTWESIPDSPINLSDARWHITQANISPFDGKLYGLGFNYGLAEIRTVVFANKTLLESRGCSVDDLYTAIDSKTWNFDMFRDYAKKCTADLDGDGVNDIWGITGPYETMFLGLIASNGGSLAVVENGTIKSGMGRDVNVEALSYIDQLVNSDKVVYFPEHYYSEETWAANYNGDAEFLKGNTAFFVHEEWNASQKLYPNAKFEYVMLPLPIGPSGKDYVTPAYNSSNIVMLRTCDDARATKAAIIYNAWAAPIDGVLDHSEEMAAEKFQSSDKRSVEIYKMIAERSVLDYGLSVGEMSAAFNHQIVSCVLWRVTTPTSALQALDGSYDDVISAAFANAVR